MAKALIKFETIADSQIRDIMAGKEPQPPDDWNDSTDETAPTETGNAHRNTW